MRGVRLEKNSLMSVSLWNRAGNLQSSWGYGRCELSCCGQLQHSTRSSWERDIPIALINGPSVEIDRSEGTCWCIRGSISAKENLIQASEFVKKKRNVRNEKKQREKTHRSTLRCNSMRFVITYIERFRFSTCCEEKKKREMRLTSILTDRKHKKLRRHRRCLTCYCD